MTIKNITLSAIAATMVTTAAFAGTVSTSSVGLIGSERLSITDVNISNATGNAVYKPSDIPAGALKNPIFKYTYTNAKDLVPGATLAVYQVKDGNESNATAGNLIEVGNTPVVSGATSNVISFNASNSSVYVYNDKKYVMRDGNATLVATLQGTVVKGSTADVTLAAALYSGDSQALNDSAPASTIATVGNEFTATVSQKLNARIDASQGFKKFYDQGENLLFGASSATQDTLKIDVTRNAVLAAGAGLNTPMINLVTFSDTNLTANSYTVTTSYNGGTPVATPNDYNATMAAAAAAAVGTSSYGVEYTINGTTKVLKTLFDAHMYVTSSDAGSPAGGFDLVTKTSGNAGKWTIYGYNAQIPNVASTGPVTTVLKFTNRSALDTDIYFTLIDQDGTVATMNSVDNPTLASLPHNTTGTYTAAALLDLVTDPAFNKNGSFSVEVSVPTTPSSVYGFASFRNSDANNFKDLPIYNSSNMTY